MFMYDPTTFGTPLTLLQIPPSAINDVQNKLDMEDVLVTRYTQDCKTVDDLKEVVAASDFSLVGESYLDVGYICRKCHMVYPSQDACVNHQTSMCYQGKKSQATMRLKLEQTQYQCTLCREAVNTLGEFKDHCELETHRTQVALRNASNIACAMPGAGQDSDGEGSPKSD